MGSSCPEVGWSNMDGAKHIYEQGDFPVGPHPQPAHHACWLLGRNRHAQGE